MKAITTKYLGPTDFKGSRVAATDGDGHRIVLPWRSEWNAEKNHSEACKALCEECGWGGWLQGGHILKAGCTVGMVWCFVDKSERVYVKPRKAFTYPAEA